MPAGNRRKGFVVPIGGDATGLQKEFKRAETFSKDLERVFDLLADAAGLTGNELEGMGRDARAVSRVAEALGVDLDRTARAAKGAAGELDDTGQQARDSGRDLGKLDEESQQLWRQMRELGQQTGRTGRDMLGAGDDARKMAADLGRAEKAADGVMGALTAIGTGGAALVAGGLGAVIGTIVSQVDEVIERTDRPGVTAALFGLDPRDRDRVIAMANDLYRDAYGESIDAAAEAVAVIDRLWGDSLTTEQLRALTADVLTFTDTTGQGFIETINAARAMVASGLVPNVREAFNVITLGQQDLLDLSGDWLDTLREFSPNFVKLGFDGRRAFDFLSQANTAGFRDLDRAANLVLEFGVSVGELTDDQKDALKELGINWRTFQEDVLGGGDAAFESLDMVLDRLRKLDDAEVERVGAALFKTPFEDSTARAVKQLNLIDEALGTNTQSLRDAATAGDIFAADMFAVTESTGDELSQFAQDAQTGLGDEWSAMWRQIKESVTDVVEPIVMPLLEGIINWFDENKEQVQEWIDAFIGWAEEEIPNLMTKLGEFADSEFVKTTLPMLATIFGALARQSNIIATNVERIINLVPDIPSPSDLGNMDTPAAPGREGFVDSFLRRINPMEFIGRGHEGTIVPGITGENRLMLLQGGEEVITRNDPRHMRHGISGRGRNAPLIGVLNVYEPGATGDDIAAAVNWRVQRAAV